MTRVSTTGGVLLLSLALLLSACDGSGTNPDPTGGPTTGSPSGTSAADLDEAVAEQVVTARYDAVHGLPPTPSDKVDVNSAGDGVVAPRSTEAERVAGALNQAIELGVLDRGDVLVEALERPAADGDGAATASLCMSQAIRATNLETGEETGATAPPDDWLRIAAYFERVGGTWLVAEITAADPASCVPPSIEADLSDVWSTFTDAWREWGRQGGDVPEEVLGLATERYAEILRDVGSIEPAEDGPEFADFVATTATRTSATGEACLQDRAQAVEWLLVNGQWRIDIVRQEEGPCS